MKIYDSLVSKELSVLKLIEIYSGCDVQRIFYKNLSPNDNSKNQPYLGGHLTDLGFLPTGEIVNSQSTSGKTSDPKRQIKYTASLNYSWISPEGRSYKAPGAKLIYYPQYPEVRLSGFLTKTEFDMGGWMDPAKKGREQGRVLFFGIKSAGEIFAYLAIPDSRIAKEINNYKSTELSGVFRELLIPRKKLSLISKRSENKYSQTDLFEGLDSGDLPLQQKVVDTSNKYFQDEAYDQPITSSKNILINELKRIHLKIWIAGKRLISDGSEKPYSAPNGGGYTMEAELGVIPNGIAEPDFLGWEVKQFGVKRFDLINSKALTLMTPEPNGGIYVNNGVEGFIRKFGRPNTRGIQHRYDFTGIHFANNLCKSTGLTLVTDGYDLESNSITNGGGSIALLDSNENIASSWSFPKLMEIWKRKHAKAVYIPSISRKEASHLKEYHYGNEVRMFQGTSIIQLLKAVSEGYVYYDPGIKLVNANTRPTTKRRSQFRIKSSALGQLYDRLEVVDVLKK
ncbi:MAG: hypothetical protein H8D23_19905 [Candidatus Brocadiales bacterium]|nr:hypothetical protein [Candidatus Brocadiales bacterium]